MEKTNLNVEIDKKTKDTLVKIATNDDRPLSSLIRNILREYIQKNEKSD